MASKIQIVKILYCKSPVAAKIPAVNNMAPVGIKKQKNKPVLPYTKRKMSSNPPYLISDSISKMDKNMSEQYCFASIYGSSIKIMMIKIFLVMEFRLA